MSSEETFTKKDLKKAFDDARKQDFYYTLGDEDTKYRQRYSTFDEWFKERIEKKAKK